MTCTKLLQLFVSMSSPSFLLANENNHTLLTSLLESINAIIEHKYNGKFHFHKALWELAEVLFSENPRFLTAVLKTRKRFEALRSFTLESGREEIEKLAQLRKESAEASESVTSPTRSSRNGSIDSLRSPQAARTPSLSNVPEEGSAFAIGDDEDDSDDDNDDDDDDNELRPILSQSSPSARNFRTGSISSIDDAVPMQLRGMSEKARGKMPVGQTSFSRVNSLSSISSNNATIGPTTSGFTPSAQWVCLRLLYVVRCFPY